jgi:hypothetical protein
MVDKRGTSALATCGLRLESYRLPSEPRCFGVEDCTPYQATGAQAAGLPTASSMAKRSRGSQTNLLCHLHESLYLR